MSFQSEKEKLKSMSIKDKFWYIGSYYKFHILAAVLVISLTAAIIPIVRRNSMEMVLNCAVINHQLTPEEEKLVNREFRDFYGIDSKTQRWSFNSSLIIKTENPTEYSYSSMAKISAWVASNDLDLILSETAMIDYYAQMDGLIDLEAWLPDDLKTALKPYFYYTENFDGGQQAYGLNLESTPLGQKTWHLTPPVLSVIMNSERSDAVCSFIRYIYGL